MGAHHAAVSAANKDATQQQKAAQSPIRNAGAFFGVGSTGALGTNAADLSRGRFLGY